VPWTERRLKLAADDIHEPSWNALVDLVVTASRGDSYAYVAAQERYRSSKALNDRGFVYAVALLCIVLFDRWPEQPTEQELRESAMGLYPRWSNVLRFDRDLLEHTLRWGRQMVDDMLAEPPVFDEVVVALAIQLSDPRLDLARHRPEVAATIVMDKVELPSSRRGKQSIFRRTDGHP
jgi:hypothetical protein